MSQHKTIITTVAWGGWYSRGVARMIQEFARVSPGFELQAWVNVLPPGAHPLIENGYDYTGYAAKPWALKYALDSGADTVLLIDAAFFPIRRIHPLIDFISENGYYLCKNGYKAGEWCSDMILAQIGTTRDHAMTIEEVSSYAVGISSHHEAAKRMATAWALWTHEPCVIAGPHTATGQQGRNPGFVSTDERVRGHRHDQSLLSLLVNQFGLDRFSERPQFTAYRGHETEETVLVNEGMGS
jgi:hypothetical protein